MDPPTDTEKELGNSRKFCPTLIDYARDRFRDLSLSGMAEWLLYHRRVCRLLHPSIQSGPTRIAGPHFHTIPSESLQRDCLLLCNNLHLDLHLSLSRSTPAATPHAGVARYSNGHHILQAFQMSTVPVRLRKVLEVLPPAHSSC